MAPDKIYIKEFDGGMSQLWSGIKATMTTANVQYEYIRADVVDETIQTAEDHAYFAGKEKLREELLEKLSVAYDAACNNVYDGPNAIKDLIESLNSM